ncbi:hypothetical protein DL769_008516 [Monosporascus sp. CRB-8-3]|nr:hypothetical protein DL769_008516 [Monosporascus sp. CRB-8-3]
MPSHDKLKALLGKAFKGAGASTAKEEEKKKKEKNDNASREAQEATSAAVTTTITTTAATSTTTPSVAPAASASACTSLPASALASTSTTTTPAPAGSASTSVAVPAASVPTPAPAPAPTHPPGPQQPPPGSVRCGRCGCRYFPAANNSLACYHHPGTVFFRHASHLGYIPSLEVVDRPYDPQAFVWTCCRGVVGRSSGCVYRRHVPVGAQGPAGRGGVSPRMSFRGENAGAFGM